MLPPHCAEPKFLLTCHVRFEFNRAPNIEAIHKERLLTLLSSSDSSDFSLSSGSLFKIVKRTPCLFVSVNVIRSRGLVWFYSLVFEIFNLTCAFQSRIQEKEEGGAHIILYARIAREKFCATTPTFISATPTESIALGSLLFTTRHNLRMKRDTCTICTLI